MPNDTDSWNSQLVQEVPRAINTALNAQSEALIARRNQSEPMGRMKWSTPLFEEAGTGGGILCRAPNGAETDGNASPEKPWIKYTKSTFKFSEETSGPAVPCNPDTAWFKKENWYGGEIVIV